VQVFSSYEDKVKEALIENIERAGLSEKFGEILVPKEEVVALRQGQKVTSQRKFFPGYILLEMDLNDETWHVVSSILFNVGDAVRVIDGPFSSFNGVVSDVLGDKGKLKVSVSIFGRPTPVELDFMQVEKG